MIPAVFFCHAVFAPFSFPADSGETVLQSPLKNKDTRLSEKFSSPANSILLSAETARLEQVMTQKMIRPDYTVTSLGLTVKTPHFIIHEQKNSQHGKRIAQELEAAWAEAQMTAKTWRNAPSRKAEQPPILVYILAEGRQEFCTIRENLNPGKYQIEIVPSLARDASQLQKEIRRTTFQSVLREGGEAEFFPQWVQTGMASLFAGDELPASVDNWKNLPMPGNETRLEESLRNQHMDAETYRHFSQVWLRYYLTADDGRNASGFLETLGEIYRMGASETETRQTEALTQKNTAAAARRQADIHRETERLLGSFAAKTAAGETPLPKTWLAAPEDGVPIILWRDNVEVITDDEEDETTADLPAAYKPILMEMGTVLKMIAKTDADASEKNEEPAHEMKIVSSDGTSGRESGTLEIVIRDASDTGIVAEIPAAEAEAKSAADRTAKESDLRRLDSVYEKIAGDTKRVFCSLDQDGTLMFSTRDREKIRKLFYPADRKYLLQTFDGQWVLSATLPDGDVLHVTLAPGTDASPRPTVYVLAYEPAKDESYTPSLTTETTR